METNNFVGVYDELTPPDVFLYGLSGSGKDTIANYLRDNYGYLKLRLAKTIKQVICETTDIEFDTLDTAKRTNSELRSAHWEIGKILDTISQKQTERDHSLNRLKHLLDKTSIEFEMVPGMKNYPFVICDTRIENELNTIFEYYQNSNKILQRPKACVIFLAKVPAEFVGDGSHKTEQNFFQNGVIERFIEQYSDTVEIHLIMNNDYTDKDRKYLSEYWVNKIGDRKNCHIYFPGTDMALILGVVNTILDYNPH